jgi:phosphoglycolate phosphatase
VQEVFHTIGTLDVVSFAGKTDWQILLESLEPAGISTQHVQARLEQYNQTAARHLARIVDQFPIKACVGAREVVTALRGHPRAVVGLVTGNTAALVPIKLCAAGYDPADFKVGAYGSEGWDRSMLPPLALSRARAYSGVNFAPEQVVIIGDTPGDIACAASIGARTIAVATGPYSADQLREYQPDHVFETMADTEAFLSAIFQDGHADQSANHGQ